MNYSNQINPLPQKQASGGSNSKVLVIVLVVIGAVVLVAIGCVIAAVALLFPAFQAAGNAVNEAANRVEAMNRGRTIVIAMQNYHDSFKKLPPPVVESPEGVPLHSWRMELLPFLEEVSLSESVDRTKPWNAAANQEWANTDVSVFKSARGSSQSPGITHFVAVVGPETCFPPKGRMTMGKIADGTSNTIMLIEYPESDVRWAEPRDVTVDEAVRIIKGSKLEEGVIVVFADASSRVISPEVNEATLRAMFTPRGED